MMTSIRRRLIFLLAVMLMAVWLITALLTRHETRDEIDAVFDAEISQSAHILLGMARREKEEIIEHGGTDLPEGQAYEQSMLYQVWDRDGIVMRSLNAPDTPLIHDDRIGFSQLDFHNQSWRLLSRWDENHNFHILIAEPIADRTALAQHITWQILLPTLALFPFLGVLIWLTVRMGLTPLQRIRQAIAERNASRMDEIPLARVPEEVYPLAASINDLLNRLKASLEGEKQFTGNAAHELRTPLAAIKTQAQVAMRADNAEDRQHALQQVIQGTERSTHLIEQLLILARVDPDNTHNEMAPVELCQVIHKVKTDLQYYASQRDIVVECDCTQSLFITGNRWQLEIVVRNLLDNALRYAPQHSLVSIHVAESKSSIILAITDQGPGISPEEQENIFKRFYRLSGTIAQGSGLGLSIVQRIVELHQAKITMHQDKEEKTFTVSLIFPKK